MLNIIYNTLWFLAAIGVIGVAISTVFIIKGENTAVMYRRLRNCLLVVSGSVGIGFTIKTLELIFS